MLQIKSVRFLLLAFSCVCLSVFLAEKTVVPLLHQHHEVHSKTTGDNLDKTSDCLACDLAKALLEAEHTVVRSLAFVCLGFGLLQLFIPVQRFSTAVIFSSLRGPPAALTA